MRSIQGKTQIMRMRIGHIIFMTCLVGSCTSFQMMIPMSSSPEATRLFRREATKESDNTSNAAALRSITFSNLSKQQEPQLLGNFLMELGACSTSITDADAGTDSEMALFDEFDPTTMTRTAVTTHVWGRCHVTAQFAASTDLDWIMDIVQDSFPDLPTYTLQEVEDKDWVLHVQQQWKPIILPPFCLRFPWHSDSLVQNAIEDAGLDENSIVPLQLQGGIAFGTGEHPTTQLCLDWIGKICSSSSSSSSSGESKKKLMDYGSGSGVLGIAASKLDDTLEAVGVDIDVDAVLIANENCQINDVGMKNYLSNLIEAQDDESQSVLLSKSYYSSKEGQIGAEVLPKELDGPIYDAVVANILAGPLVVLAPRLAGLLKPSCGKLGLSGIMTSQSNMILDSYEPYFDDLKVEQELGGWVLITGTRKED